MHVSSDWLHSVVYKLADEQTVSFLTYADLLMELRTFGIWWLRTPLLWWTNRMYCMCRVDRRWSLAADCIVGLFRVSLVPGRAGPGRAEQGPARPCGNLVTLDSSTTPDEFILAQVASLCFVITSRHKNPSDVNFVIPNVTRGVMRNIAPFQSHTLDSNFKFQLLNCRAVLCKT